LVEAQEKQDCGVYIGTMLSAGPYRSQSWGKYIIQRHAINIRPHIVNGKITGLTV